MTLYIEEVDEDDPGPSVPPDLDADGEAEGSAEDAVVDLGRLDGPGAAVSALQAPSCKATLVAQTKISRGGASLAEVGDKLFVFGGADRTGKCFGDVHNITPGASGWWVGEEDEGRECGRRHLYVQSMPFAREHSELDIRMLCLFAFLVLLGDVWEHHSRPITCAAWHVCFCAQKEHS